MNDNKRSSTVLPGVEPDRMFPRLTPEQVARIAAQGRSRQVTTGEVLLEAGATYDRFFVVRSGQIEIIRVSGELEEVIAVCGEAQLTGEMSLVSGRRILVRLRAAQPGEVIELDRNHLLGLVQVDSELGEVLMRAFLLRRLDLIARGIGDVVLVGSRHSADTLRLQEFLSRNGHPYASLDVERDPDVQTLLDHFQVAVEEVPIVICHASVTTHTTGARA
jgi:thioredoxin reductase (NADPH)